MLFPQGSKDDRRSIRSIEGYQEETLHQSELAVVEVGHDESDCHCKEAYVSEECIWLDLEGSNEHHGSSYDRDDEGSCSEQFADG